VPVAGPGGWPATFARVAVLAPCAPWGRTTRRRSRRRATLPRLRAVGGAVGRFAGTGFDAGRSAAEFLHELLVTLVSGLSGGRRWKSGHTSYSRSTASPTPGRLGPSLRQLAPLCLSGQSRAMWPAFPQTRQMMLAV